MMNATCGQKCLEQFERLPRVGSWAKTFAALLVGTGDWYSTRCKLTWKLVGTKSSRLYFQLVPKTLPTEGIEFGLLPTPSTTDWNTPFKTDQKTRFLERRMQNGKTTTPSSLNQLRQMAYEGLLPTPVSRDWKGAQAAEYRKLRGQKGSHESVVSLPGFVGAIGKTSQLNPLFVEEMMGFPPGWTELPFQSGETNLSKPTETQ